MTSQTPTLGELAPHTPNAAETEQLNGAFAQALAQANATGSSTVGFRNSSVDAAGTESPETGYDITVVRVGAAQPAA